jgi:hypothetical protein
MTQEMRDRLALLVSKQPRDTTEADLIREAIRLYLDNQEDIIGSRKHFQKSLQERLDRLESAFAFHLNVLIYLLAPEPNYAERPAAKTYRAVPPVLVDELRTCMSVYPHHKLLNQAWQRRVLCD